MLLKLTPATVPALEPVRFQVPPAAGPNSVSEPWPPTTLVMPLMPPVPVAVFAARFTVTADVYAE